MQITVQLAKASRRLQTLEAPCDQRGLTQSVRGLTQGRGQAITTSRDARDSSRTAEARALFEQMLSHRTASGLLSEDIGLEDGRLWGNYPQTYSLVGLINCASLLSRPWSTAR